MRPTTGDGDVQQDIRAGSADRKRIAANRSREHPGERTRHGALRADQQAGQPALTRTALHRIRAQEQERAQRRR